MNRNDTKWLKENFRREAIEWERDDIDEYIKRAIKRDKNWICYKNFKYKENLTQLISDGFEVKNILTFVQAIEVNMFWKFLIFGRFYLIVW